MARKVRIEYPGAVYHVMSRGNQGQAIYKNDEDRFRFLETVSDACEKSGWQIHAYVLMGNHYHMLLDAFSFSRRRGSARRK
jgi:REP element-mobilizing transposase RayT